MSLAGGGGGSGGVSTQKEGMCLEKLPEGLQFPGPHQLSIGTAT